MTKTQRLKGTVARTAAMIVTAATAGAVIGQDDCDDVECLAEQSISAFTEALTAGDATGSEEALSELFTDMRPLSDIEHMADLFTDADPNDFLTENVTLNFITEMLEAQGMSSEQVEQILEMSEQMGLVGGGGGGAGKVNAPADPNDFLTENVTLNFITEMLEAQGMSSEQVEQILEMSGAFGTLIDEEGKAVVINHEEQYDPTDPAEPLSVLGAAALQAYADGDIDKPTLDALMEVLLQE